MSDDDFKMNDRACAHAKVASGWSGSFRFDPMPTEDDIDDDEEWHDHRLMYVDVDGDEINISEGLDSHVLASLADLLNASRDWPVVATLLAKADALRVERDKYRDALHYLRRKIDGYDSTFEYCGVDDFKGKDDQP